MSQPDYTQGRSRVSHLTKLMLADQSCCKGELTFLRDPYAR